jgi:hypothetical protein
MAGPVTWVPVPRPLGSRGRGETCTEMIAPEARARTRAE